LSNRRRIGIASLEQQEADRYRKAADDALHNSTGQLDTCTGSEKVQIARALAPNRAHIRRESMKREQEPLPTQTIKPEKTLDPIATERATPRGHPQRPRLSRLAGVIDVILDKALEYVDPYVRPAQPEGGGAKRSAPSQRVLRSGRTPGTERGEWPGCRCHPAERAERWGSPGPTRAAAGRDYLDGARASCRRHRRSGALW
jgi:hypothetical protein